MKANLTIKILVLFVTSQLFFACSTSKYYDFGSSGTAYHGNKKAVAAKKAAMETETSVALINDEPSETNSNLQEPVLEASAANVPHLPKKAIYEGVESESYAAMEVAPPADLKTLKNDMSKAERKALKKLLKKELKKQNSAEKPAVVSTFLLVVLAIFIPPLAVFLVRGISGAFWLNLLLTLLFVLPGIIHALIIVLTR